LRLVAGLVDALGSSEKIDARPVEQPAQLSHQLITPVLAPDRPQPAEGPSGHGA
jgi:hypothetical protein